MNTTEPVIEDFNVLLEETKRKYRLGDRSWTPTVKEHYHYFKGVLPPAYVRNLPTESWLAGGESYTHDDNGMPVYLCFKVNNDGYFARYANLGEFDTERRLFIGVYPSGLVYADRDRERSGDWVKLAFLPYDTLEVEWHGEVPPLLREVIQKDADAMFQKVLQEYSVSSSGQTVMLGSKYNYLIHCNGKGAFVTMKPEDSSDYYGKVQDAFKEAGGFRGKFDFVDMVRLHHDQVTPNGVRYQWELAGPDGAWYRLIQLPGMTPEQIEKAKAWLRHSFDVVKLEVLHVKELIKFKRP